jgi:Protein of unknown function (DUF4054)
VSYVVPTANDLQAKYPAFADVADATIDLYIADAQVDTSWLEADYATAIMLWAAWAMTNVGIGTGGEVAGYIGSGVSRLKSGTLDVSFSDSAASLSGYETNIYGRQFLALLRKNKGGPRVVRGNACANGWGPTGVLNYGGIVPWAS